MFSLKGLFGARSKISRLEAALQTITVDDAVWGYDTASDPRLKIPHAISMTVLRMAHSFTKGLLDVEDEFSKKLQSPNHSASYDVIAYETAAFAHWWAMKDYRLADLSGSLDDDDDGEYAVDPLVRDQDAALIGSATLSGGFIAEFTTFQLPRKAFVYRAMSYCEPHDTNIAVTELAGRFEHKMSCSIFAGMPTNQKQQGFDLSLNLAMKTCIPTFQTHSLVALSELVDRLFKAEKAGPAQ